MNGGSLCTVEEFKFHRVINNDSMQAQTASGNVFYKKASNDIHNSCNCLPSFQWMEFSIQEMFDGRIAPLCCNYLTECLFVLRSSKFIQICQHKKGPCYFTQKNAPKTKDIVVQEEYSLVARLLACDPLGLLELIFYALWVLKPCDSCRIVDGQQRIVQGPQSL